MRSLRCSFCLSGFPGAKLGASWGLICGLVLGLVLAIGQSGVAQPPGRFAQAGARIARAPGLAWRGGVGNATAFGPGGTRGQVDQAKAFPQDAGPALVDLIQRQVAPQFWAPNGGPGTIHYWRPGRALVVRATEDVHFETAKLLEQLRRAGQ